MSQLFTFLENFDIENFIKIYEDGNLIFAGKIGDVPQRNTNGMSVIRGTAKWKDYYLEVTVKSVN